MADLAHIRIARAKREGFDRLERRSSGGAFESTIARPEGVDAILRKWAAYEPSEVWDARTLPAKRIEVA